MQKPLRFPPREKGINLWLAPLPSPPPPGGLTRAPCAPQSPPPAARPEAGRSRGRAEARGAARHGGAALRAATPTCLLVVIAHHNEVIGQPGHGCAGRASASPPQRLQRRLGTGSASSAPRPPQEERHHLSHVGGAGAPCACAPPGPLAVTSGLGGGWGGPARLSRNAAAPGRPPCRYAAGSAATSLRSTPAGGEGPAREVCALAARGLVSRQHLPVRWPPWGAAGPGNVPLSRKTRGRSERSACPGRLGCCREELSGPASPPSRLRGNGSRRRDSASPSSLAWGIGDCASRMCPYHVLSGVCGTCRRGGSRPAAPLGSVAVPSVCARSRSQTSHISTHTPERAVLSGPAWAGLAAPRGSRLWGRAWQGSGRQCPGVTCMASDVLARARAVAAGALSEAPPGAAVVLFITCG